MLKDWTRSLPEDRFPIARSVVDVLFAADPDERFEFGIDVIRARTRDARDARHLSMNPASVPGPTARRAPACQ
jgi:hypothetical protein